MSSIPSLNLLIQLEEDIQPYELDTVQDRGGLPSVLVDQHPLLKQLGQAGQLEHDAHEAKVEEHVLLRFPTPKYKQQIH